MTVTTYASPGTDIFRSQKYVVTAAAVGGTQSAGLYVYGQTYAAVGENEVWDMGQQVQVDWITIGSDETVDARVSLIDGPIFDAQVYPRDVGVTQAIVDGQLRLTVPPNRRLRIEVNGDRRSPLHLFLSLPEAALPVGSVAFSGQTSVAANTALHFPAGVHVVAPGLVLGNNCTVTAQGGAVVIFDDPDIGATAASATASSVTVSGTPWTVGAYNGAEVRITGGTGSGQVRTISTSTTNTLNVTSNWTTTPTAGSTFSIIASKRAGFDLSTLVPASNLAGVTIQGHGIFTSLAQRANAEKVQSFANQVKYCPIATDTVSTSPVNCRIVGPTFVRWPFYLQYAGAHYLRNVQWLNPWTYNSDGFQPGRKSLSDNAGLVCDSFSFCADDGVKLFFPDHRITVQNTFIVAARANCFKVGYFGNFVNDSSGAQVIDCDAMNLGDADANVNGPLVYPNRGTQCIVSAFVDAPNATPTIGYYNISVTGLRVWGRMYSRLFCFQNVQYPFAGVTPQDAAGQIFDVRFVDVATEAVPGQPSLILGRDSISTPHDLTFTDVLIAGTKLTRSNYTSFVEVNAFPYNVTWDAAEPIPVPVGDTAALLWEAVERSYDIDGLVSLTNIRDRSATSINTEVGRDASQGVIDLWPIYAQVAYDPTNRVHVETAKRAVIALLWARGGAAMSIAKVEWDEVFSGDGLIAKVRQTGSRSRTRPSSNSGVQQKSEANMGRPVRGWSDPDALPTNYLPLRRLARDD